MVGSRNQQRINVFAGHHLAKIRVGRTIVILVLPVDRRARLFQLFSFDVAYRDDLRALFVEEIAHVPLPLGTHSNATDRNSIAGRDPSAFAQSRRRNDRWQRDRKSTRLNSSHTVISY